LLDFSIRFKLLPPTHIFQKSHGLLEKKS
jgi:hypothetical protein